MSKFKTERDEKRMKAWFQRFMSGRYGNDSLGNFLCIVSLVCLILGMFLSGILYYVGIALLAFCYYRMLSRNITKRRDENAWFQQKKNIVLRWFNVQKLHFDQRKTYHYYKCPRCHQELRVPVGRGRISITCPKCGTNFIKKS